MKKLAWLLVLSLAPASLAAQLPKLKPAEQSIVNEQGIDVGLAVRVGNVKMTLNATHLGPISAPGMPSILPAHDGRDRDEFIRSTAGAAFAQLRYSKNDYLASVSIGNGYRLEFTDPDNGKVQETLHDANGKLLHVGVTNGMVDRTSREMGLCLDVVASDLGLGVDWPQQVTFSRSESGSVTTVSDHAGNPLLYVLNYGPFRAGYLPSGKALFYDIPLSTAATPRQSYMETDLGDSPMGFMNGVAMSRIQITADGRVCAYATRVSLGAIMSFWTTRDANGHPVYGYRKADPTPEAQTQSRVEGNSETTPEERVRRHLRPITPESFYTCGSETACSTCDYCGADGGYGTDCTTTYYVCWADDGGGGGGDLGGGAGGGGGSGSTSPGNQIYGDSILSAHVNMALSNAQNKLQNLSSNCVTQILGLSDGAGHTLAQNLANMTNGPWSPYTYMTQVLGYTNGYSSGTCSSANAWMSGIFQTQVNVCSSFSNLPTGLAGNALIHEFLHSIGLPELPKYPNATMNSSQITTFVNSACGTN